MAKSTGRKLDPSSMRDLSDIQLMRRIERFDTKERELTLYILYHLGELDRRRLYLRQGYSSLFDFCIRHLNYSEAAAGRRIRAARTIRDYPEVAARYEAREVSVTTISRIAGIITKKNCGRLLDAVAGRRKNDVEMIVSRFRPRERIIEKVKPVFVLTAVPLAPDEISGRPGTGSGGSWQATDPHPDDLGLSRSGVCTLSSLNTTSFGEGGRSSTAAGGGKNPSTFPVHIDEAVDPADRSATGDDGRPAGDDGRTAGDDDRPGGESFPGTPCRKTMTQRLKYRLEFGIDPDLMQKIERVKQLLSTKYPGNVSLEQLLAELIDEYLDRHSPEARRARRERRSSPSSGTMDNRPAGVEEKASATNEAAGAKVGQTRSAGGKDRLTGKHDRLIAGQDRLTSEHDRLIAGQDSEVSTDGPGRHIPRHIRDEVYSRDGGRCSFVGPDGTRCGSEWNVQIDHIRPFSKGGDHSPENLRLLCAKHNR
ncbi:MAG TPA: HNH endonuclease signature motif containing protein, partial [Candidatus Krumholzibacterium sp.]|nr:HNH endonuclease signature motif containing protein [Candidatus Krumholzibacterium sp.]